MFENGYVWVGRTMWYARPVQWWMEVCGWSRNKPFVYIFAVRSTHSNTSWYGNESDSVKTFDFLIVWRNFFSLKRVQNIWYILIKLFGLNRSSVRPNLASSVQMQVNCSSQGRAWHLECPCWYLLNGQRRIRTLSIEYGSRSSLYRSGRSRQLSQIGNRK